IFPFLFSSAAIISIPRSRAFPIFIGTLIGRITLLVKELPIAVFDPISIFTLLKQNTSVVVLSELAVWQAIAIVDDPFHFTILEIMYPLAVVLTSPVYPPAFDLAIRKKILR